MNHYKFSMPLIFCMLTACAEQKKEAAAESSKESGTTDTPAILNSTKEGSDRQFAVRPGVRIRFIESHPVGRSTSDVEVKVEGDVTAELAFRDIDPVIEILEGDLNNDGSKEWYIITSAAGSGSYGNIKAVTVSKESGLDEILIPDLTAVEGYQGHDQFSIQDGKLVRRFPVYKKEDQNANPAGGEKEIRYTLIQFPGGKYALDPEK